ncbi:nitrate reductase [Carbonactinospora thermoautotrophica]|uniref:Nitrate reductase n=2 Tax=Carbonactinospora thermoautotrophica TaxID=1469144 RepID=A0A132MU46_9ACTN|nr:nitrate reductase molybdenum cofactor assembly chaperone [Carbonactinospora thermoautotrophica]KWW97670.1 nitrate reductase [Carbonactinospora thermoautotrophica]KWX00892.1 Respiratory nitrate reductase delta chain [Carbonactinospora thermoautotrophica]
MRLTDEQRRIAHQAASLLLSYPDETLSAAVPALRAAAAELPEPVAAPLRRIIGHVADTPLADLATEYVATFDLKRRCCLYLTYYAYGDTRKRGLALLRFQQAYRSYGFDLTGQELPDHLAVVLEFSARGATRTAGRLLREHRAGLELLWQALRDLRSPYADAVAAVRATLPPAGPRDLAAALRLAEQGPPAEEVGLEPYPSSPDPLGGRR